MAGFAIRSRFASQPGRSAKTRYALRLKTDHSIGAGQACASNIKSDIMVALNRSWFSPKKIDVSAYDGKVTLTGTVDYWDERALAGTTAWAAPGVTSVINEIRVH